MTNYIKFGGESTLALGEVAEFKSGIPAFETILNDGEIAAVLTFIKSSWPEKVLQIQRERTKINNLFND